MILLHGLFGMGDNLGALSRALSTQYQVISVDLRNHGRSPWADSMALADMAGDVIALLDRLGVEMADVVGHSLGGKVAMQVALDYPNRVRRLVVADIAPVEYAGNHDEVFKALAAVTLSTVQSRSEVAAILAEQLEEEGVPQFLLKSLYRTEQGSYAWRMNVGTLFERYQQLRAGYDGSGQFNGPTLFIKGENSNYVQAQHQSCIEKLFPHYRFKIIQGTGHWLHVEKPAVFNGLVERFLLEAFTGR